MMIASVEARGFRIGAGLQDFVVTTAHISGPLGRAHALWPELVGGDPRQVITEEDLAEFWRNPPDSVRKRLPEIDTAWANNSSHLIEQFVQTQMFNSFETLTDLEDALGPLSNMLAQIRSDIEHDLKSPTLTRPGVRKVFLCALMSLHLSGAYVGPDNFEFSRKAYKDLSIQGLPFSHSPGLESITLKDLLSKGIKSVCLVPLGAGVYSSTGQILAGKFALAFEVTLSGGGVTLCALSTLWLADKILRGIKNVDSSEDIGAD